MIDDEVIIELLRVKGKYIFHREGQCLEFKEQFNLAGLAGYFRDFAAFANNRGGFLIFGVTDSPRIAAGLSKKALDAFNRIDPERISGFLLEIFSSGISWEQTVVINDGGHFGVFKIAESEIKPVIARKDEGRDQVIRNGDIYFRYGGRTQRIQFAELESIINKRIERTNRDWIDLVKEIGPGGPREALVIKTNQQLKDSPYGSFVVDRELAEKLKFIKEGQFKEKDGAATLKLIGDIVPFDTVEVEKIVKENLLKQYPFSATELAQAVIKRTKGVGKNTVWRAITENRLKGNSVYSAYNFRNRKQQEAFEKSGKISSATPVLYNSAAVDFLVKLHGD